MAEQDDTGGCYGEFQSRAADSTLTNNEKIGFTESCRAGKEEIIADDIFKKLQISKRQKLSVLDIGCGCGPLAAHIIERVLQGGHLISVVDSPEMLAALEIDGGVKRIAGRFPDCAKTVRHQIGPVDRIIVYSVLQYAFKDGCAREFVEAAASLLAERGRLLIGDIPNASMRKRFLSSASGQVHHRTHFDPDNDPDPKTIRVDGREIDDAFLLELVANLRRSGFNAFMMPQASGLPLANRREDLLIIKS